MNTIGAIRFDFDMQDEGFARRLYARWEQFFPYNVERIADEVLSKYKLKMKNEELRIDQLELDLGSVSAEELDRQFPVRFGEKLEEALTQCLYHAETQQNVKRIPQKENIFQLLCEFLLHGTLSWNASEEYRDIHKLFLKVLQEKGKELKQFLQAYGHYTSLQQRLVYQLNDPELEKGVHLLTPEAGNFIIGYVHFLRAKYNDMEKLQTTGSHYRNAVWLVVYAYLLTQRSSYFDKKSFITQTILQLAAKHNLSYDSLLTLLTHELEVFQKKLTIPLELFQLLASLRKELSEKRLKESFIDAAKFYKTLYQSIKKELDKQVSESGREGLIHILANPYTCRMFLQQLSEPEIIRLIPVVIPNESDFVIKVAKVIDNGNLSNIVRHKLSTLNSPLSTLKWQIIFPILLEKRGTRFNRKQFVRAVLQQMAAHYNLEFSLLMESFLRQSELLTQTDNELKSIFAELERELGMEESLSERTQMTQIFADRKQIEILYPLHYQKYKNPRSSASSAFKIPFSIDKNFQLSVKQFLQRLSDNSFRKKIIDQTREPQRYRLVQLMYPKEQEFIISYIKSLDKLHEHSSLEAKAGGDFSSVKWMFLFTVLSEMPGDSFNRCSFVGRVLQQVAAHYNLTYFDLLLYFHQEKTGIQLPFHLEQLLDELYQEEKEHWLEMILRDGQETVNYQYLACFKGIDTTFVKAFLRTLDGYHDKGSLQGKTSGRLNELKWRFIFEVLLASQTIAFNKKQFVRCALAKMAAHYQLSLYELLAYLKEISAVSGNAYSKEVEKIIQDLYREQEEQRTSSTQKKPADKNTIYKKETDNTIELTDEETNPVYIHNAGVALITPYLPKLFNMLDLTENNKFKNNEAQIRAIYLIQFIVFGTTDFPEHEMTLNKLLTGFKSGTPLPRHIEPTEKEIETINSMLNAALQHWSKLKNKSISVLREGFLQREGKLEEKEDFYQLTVEEKSYDMLLDSCPWNFRTIRFPWMKKITQIKWR